MSLIDALRKPSRAKTRKAASWIISRSSGSRIIRLRERLNDSIICSICAVTPICQVVVPNQSWCVAADPGG